MPAALEGALFLAGALLLVVGGAALILTSSALSALPAAKRVLTLQLSAVGVFAVSGTLRGILIATGQTTPAYALALGIVDTLLTIVFWLGILELTVLFQGGAERARERRWSPWPHVLVGVLVYTSVSTALPQFTTDLQTAFTQLTDAGIIAAFGLAMVQLNRLLRVLERPSASVLPLASVAALAFGLNASNVAAGLLGNRVVAGLDTGVGAMAGVLIAGAFLAVSAVTLLVVVHRGNVASAVVQRVLDDAAISRMRTLVGRIVQPARVRPEDVLDAPGALATTVTRCKVCGKQVDGVEYHAHGAPELDGLKPRDVGLLPDAYRRMRPEDRAVVLEKSPAWGRGPPGKRRV